MVEQLVVLRVGVDFDFVGFVAGDVDNAGRWIRMDAFHVPHVGVHVCDSRFAAVVEIYRWCHWGCFGIFRVLVRSEERRVGKECT